MHDASLYHLKNTIYSLSITYVGRKGRKGRKNVPEKKRHTSRSLQIEKDHT